MYPVHPPNPKIVATLTALPWLFIWIAALVILAENRFQDIPFEHSLAWILAIGSPLAAWRQLRGYWS